MSIIIFFVGSIFGLMTAPKIAGAIGFIIRAQMKIYERQCRIFMILRKRYRDKDAIIFFKEKDK